jgi:outer membrane autotransporter protein
MKQENTFIPRRKVLINAVAAALPVLMAANVHAATTTSGITVDGPIYPGGNSVVTNASGSTIGITNATAAGASVWVEGVGNTVNNDGTITRSSSSGTTYGLFLGDYTVARNNTSNKGVTGNGGGEGSTTLRITVPAGSITSASQLVGKNILMAGLVVDGEARPGDLRAIASATAVSGSPNTFDITISGAGWTRDQVGNSYNLLAGSGLNTLNNTGIINAAYTGTATANVRAVETNIAGDYVINNSGTISAAHTSVGTPQGIDAGGDVVSMVINNSGTIRATRTSPDITLTANSATSLKGSGGVITNQNIGSGAAIYSQEELETITINNTGTVLGEGDFTPAIYLRAAEQVIVNEGEISGSRKGSGPYTYGMAIGSVSDGGEIRTLELENKGTINGDVLAVNGNAYRWYALSTQGTLDDRLNINSNWGQLDSTITNSGAINGSFYFSNGTHVLTNEAGGTITGNIDVDQRDTICNNTSGCSQSGNLGENTHATTSANATVVGTKNFTFENAGTFNGNLTIRTASSNALGHTVASDITLIPTINGSGAGSSLASPSANIAGMGNTLNLITAAGGDQTNVTIQPKVASGVTVKDGEFFKVANTYQINGLTVAAGTANVPSVASTNSLISWSAAVNNLGNLVLESAVNGASSISGISGSAASALDALLAFDSELGSTIQNLNGDDAVRKAAEQIRPEINNAGFQAVMGVTDKVFGLVEGHLGDTHLAQLTGKSGIATGDQPIGTGVWLQGFGFRGDQDRRKSVDGYTADAYGFAIGADTLVGSGATRLGAAFSYGKSNIDDKGVNQGNKLDIDSYQVSLYGSLLLDGWYLNGSLGLGKHNYDSKRIVLGNAVNGSHDAWQYSAKVDAGWPLKMGAATLVPVAALTYIRLNEDSYTESGVGALAVSSRDTDSFRSGLGAKALIPLHEGDVQIGLELRAIWNHEFADTAQDSTARFAAGGGSFTTSGVRPARDSANLGASLRLAGGGKEVRQSLLLSYDAEVKDQYLSHTALLQARFDF